MSDTHKDNFDDWLKEYEEKGEKLKTKISSEIFKSLQFETMGEAKSFLKSKRNAVEFPFCLMLYGSRPNTKLARELSGDKSDIFDKIQLNDSLSRVKDRGNSQPMTLLMMFLYEQIGHHLLMLEREPEGCPEGPIRIAAPDEYWFESFQLLAELAQAIIVITNMGDNLLKEVYYLSDHNLANRILIYADFKVIQYQEGTGFDNAKSWNIWDGLGDAVKYTAAL